MVWLKSYQFHCSHPGLRKTRSPGYGNTGSDFPCHFKRHRKYPKSGNFLSGEPMCAHNKGSFPPIGFCLNGFLWYRLSSALTCSYLNLGILLNSKTQNALYWSQAQLAQLWRFLPPSCLRLGIKSLGFPIQRGVVPGLSIGFCSVHLCVCVCVWTPQCIADYQASLFCLLYI